MLLANKANAATIALEPNKESPAVIRAMESSESGGPKLTNIAGAVCNHRDGETGHQDRHRSYMPVRVKKMLLYDIDDDLRYPDVSNTRYNSNEHGAAELVKFAPLYDEWLLDVGDAKTQPGLNHTEQTFLNGLRDKPTFTELIAMAVYGCLISWPYMKYVRTPGLNLLDLEDYHTSIVVLCRKLSTTPSLILDDTPAASLTLDGAPFLDPHLMMEVRMIAPEFPDLPDALAETFAGAVEGWIEFSQDFEEFSRIPDAVKEGLFIPTVNDHPSSTARTFSHQTRAERNNTEAFIRKHARRATTGTSGH